MIHLYSPNKLLTSKTNVFELTLKLGLFTNKFDRKATNLAWPASNVCTISLLPWDQVSLILYNFNSTDYANLFL